MIKVNFKRLPHAESLPLPRYETPLSAGMDIRAAVGDEPVLIEPGQRALVPTGFQVAIPSGYEIQARPRSGLAIRHGITMLNSPGTIDADYRGEIKMIVINHGQETFQIQHGDRIAQLVVSPVIQCEPQEADELDSTQRGDGGFGSTGV
ncbi:MAG: dUTP pyrophosphatase Dut [Bacteroidetes bacterium HLUCCA01]|nr:MAG: dUTP pyrophosphatase Dut [Bacteroidetes bacterium HLUCCA01]